MAYETPSVGARHTPNFKAASVRELEAQLRRDQDKQAAERQARLDAIEQRCREIDELEGVK